MATVASLIARAVRDADGIDAAAIADEVTTLVTRHPAYPRG